jgi:hypothetical protein
MVAIMKRFINFASLLLVVLFCGVSCTPAANVTQVTATDEALVASSSTSQDGSQTAPIFFDDFSYSNRDEMINNGWIVRDGTGWPGVTGARFRAKNVTFLDAPDIAGNRLLRMTSSTDGTAEGTFQTQICQQRKYLEGTYAARVRFYNEPVSGPDGDEVVETFYAITPYVKAMDPDYSEMDFEYLANGGWGSGPTSFYVTTWETVRIEPWNADNMSQSINKNLEGWHTLVAQVSNGEVRYFVDSLLVAQHGGKYYPDAPMSINFNLWFIEGGLLSAGDLRKYQEDIDWVFYQADAALTPDEVNAKVDSLRETSVNFTDTIPAWTPAMESPCDL